jgi:uncharacterized protein YukE
MSLFGDIERTASDVVHVGEDVAKTGADAVGDVAGMLKSLHSFLADAGLGDVVRELGQLAEEADQIKRQLASVAGSADWSGAAAEAFGKRAQQRRQQLGELVAALDSAHEAVAAAYAAAGIF